jgi:hypothetical protein
VGSERAPIEEEEQLFPPMQLQGPSNVAVDDGGGEGSEVDGEGEADFQSQLERLVRGRGPSLLDDIELFINRAGEGLEDSSSSDADGESAGPSIEEEEKEPDPGGAGQRSAPPRSLIEEEDEEEAPAFASPLMDDIEGARELQQRVGADPYRGLIEAGEVLQGGANAARRRGEGRYGAAVMHSLGGLAVKAASGEGGVAAGNASKKALKPLTAAAVPATLAKDAAKYTVGNLISTTGQAVQKIGEGRRDAVDPEGILEKQRLIDLKNQHEHGYDKQSEDQILDGTKNPETRRQAVTARGVRFEKGDHAKKIWDGPKKRSWGRIAQNGWMAVPRGIGKAVKGLVTSPASALKGIYNPIAKYGRKAGNWLSNNRWNRRRRANNALETLRTRAAAPDEATRYPAAAKGALRADSPLGTHRFLNFRGAEAAIGSHTRKVRQAQGFDNILGQKDYEKLDRAERVEYRELERNLLTGSSKYANVADKFGDDSALIRTVANQFDDPAAAPAQPGDQQAPANAAPQPGEDGSVMLSKKEAPDFQDATLPKDKNTGSSAVEGIAKAVEFGSKLGVEIPKKAAPVVGGITHVLSKTVPDMLEGDEIEKYMPTAQGAAKFGKDYEAYNANTALYRAGLMAEGVGTAADLFKTGKQYLNRDKDPRESAAPERRMLEDNLQMTDRVRALLKAKVDAGASEESIARTKRLRNRLMMVHRVTANRKLARAQEMNGITPLNEYTKKESDFITKGNLSEEKEVGAKGVGELGKEFAKSTKKMLGSAIPVFDTNKANTAEGSVASEIERLYGAGGKEGYLRRNLARQSGSEAVDPQLEADGTEQEAIEEEEKRPSGDLDAGSNSQDAEVSEDDRPRRPSEWDFNVDSDEEPAVEQAPVDIAEEFAPVDDGARRPMDHEADREEEEMPANVGPENVGAPPKDLLDQMADYEDVPASRASARRAGQLSEALAPAQQVPASAVEQAPVDSAEEFAAVDDGERQRRETIIRRVSIPRRSTIMERRVVDDDDREEEKVAASIEPDMVNAEVDEPAQQANIDPAPSKQSAAQKMAARGLFPLIAEEATSMNAGSYVSGSADNVRVVLERLGIGKAGR